jgi:hypothetical protein
MSTRPNSSFRGVRRSPKGEGVTNPEIHIPESWLWIPGSLVSLAPRNDSDAKISGLVLPPRLDQGALRQLLVHVHHERHRE